MWWFGWFGGSGKWMCFFSSSFEVTWCRWPAKKRVPDWFFNMTQGLVQIWCSFDGGWMDFSDGSWRRHGRIGFLVSEMGTSFGAAFADRKEPVRNLQETSGRLADIICCKYYHIIYTHEYVLIRRVIHHSWNQFGRSIVVANSMNKNQFRWVKRTRSQGLSKTQ